MNSPTKTFRREAAVILGLSALLITCAWRKWLPIDLTEAIGFGTGAICVWLVTRGNIWNWPIGLVNNVVFVVLFWNARLFADAGLQAIYFALGIWGWWQWLHGGVNRLPLPVTRTRAGEWIGIAIFLTLGTWGLRELLIAIKGAVPFWDAATTTLCLAAQYLLCRKRVENWWLWIVADVIYVPLYLSRGLPLTAILYAGFIGLCLIGLKRWKSELA